MIQVHKNQAHQRDFECRDDQTQGDIQMLVTQIHPVSYRYRNEGEEDESRTNLEIGFNAPGKIKLMSVVSGMIVPGMEMLRSVAHGSELH